MTYVKPRWDGQDQYDAWCADWLKAHEHELPSHVRSRNGRLVPLGKKHRWQFADRAWLEMRRQVKAEERTRPRSPNPAA
jgi:hypothetical protein